MEWEQQSLSKTKKEPFLACMQTYVLVKYFYVFSNFVLEISDGFHDMGEIRWQLALCLLAAWILVGICLIRGIKSQGKVWIKYDCTKIRRYNLNQKLIFNLSNQLLWIPARQKKIK